MVIALLYIKLAFAAPDIPSWGWFAFAALLLLVIFFIVYFISLFLYEKKMTKRVQRSNKRLALILDTTKIHIWLYDIAKQTITSIDHQGNKTTTPLSPYFLQYYMVPADYEQLCRAFEEMASEKKERETLEVHVTEGNSRELFVFSLDMSVMKRNRKGKPTVIIGATTNITAERKNQQMQKDTMLRYKHIFNSALVDTVSYDEHGCIDDMNEKAAKAFPLGIQSIIDAHISVQSVLDIPGLTADNMDYTYLTQIFTSADDPRPLNRYLKRDKLYYELQLVPVRDDHGQLLGIYGTGRDVTETANSYSLLKQNVAQLQKATDELQDYIRNIDYVMRFGGIRVVNYSPETHTLLVYSEIGRIQQKLTQARLLSLTSEESRKTVQRLLNNMDNRTRQPVKAAVSSILRIKGGNRLCLNFSFLPILDANGHVTEYFGMCRDISNIKATEEQLARETVKAQEIETVKNAFLRNMSYEIRTPLTSVVGFAELFEMEHDVDDEQFFIEEIKKNSRTLLNLVNNILFLSRLDAGMIEIKTMSIDFATFFEERCQNVWAHHRQPGVDYIVDSSYKRLVLDVDLSNLSIVIEQIVTNAVQNTTSGSVHASFDYNGENLTMTVQDTGSGIPDNLIDRIFERFVTTGSDNSGLGLPICQEVVRLMGGRIHLKSERGKGTIVWIIIPCTCREIQRKN